MNEAGLEGKLVILRRITMNDVTPEYLAWLNDDDVTRGLDTIVKPYPMEMLHKYVNEIVSDENTYMFMVVAKDSGKSIGTAKIHGINKKNGTCNLGMMLGNKNYWGKGYGQDTYMTAIDFAFTHLKIRKIWEAANENNIASLSMCAKAGFQEEGRLKEQVLSDGKYIDKILLGLFAKNWKK
jgi:RimJ/RimL family protein N-acetyltransferase